MTDSPIRVFLDANILAKPVTRTLLMAGGPPSGFLTVWSRTAEHEALRHMRPRAVSPAVVRRRFGGLLGPTGDVGGRFEGTSEADRQILADAEAAGAAFLVTEDVDDFAESDLVSVGMSAVNPDLFLASRVTRAAYAMVIDLFVARQVAPPTTRHSSMPRSPDSTLCCSPRTPTSSTSLRSSARTRRRRPCSAARDPSTATRTWSRRLRRTG